MIFSFRNIYSQLSEIQFENITAADGLVDDDITFDIYQDRQGFIWFATIEGLSRYDGYTFKNFRADPLDSTSLSDGWNHCIHEDDKGQLWFGSGNGLNLYDPISETFKNFIHDPNDSTSISDGTIYDIVQGVGNNLWIATNNGLNSYNFKTNKFNHFRYNEKDSLSLSTNYIEKLYVDRRDNLWIGAWIDTNRFDKSGSALSRYHPESNSFIKYNNLSKNKCGIIDSIVFEINEDIGGNLFVGTTSMLYRYDRSNDCFERLNNDDKTQLFAPIGKNFAGVQTGVWNIIQDINEEYWVTTFGGGINRFDIKNGFMQHYPSSQPNDLSLISNNIRAFYQDNQGLIWLSAYKNGIYKITPSNKRFHSFSKNKELEELISDVDVREIFEDSFGTYWIGTSEDVLHFNPKSGEIKKYGDILDFKFRHITDFYEDSFGQLWIAGTLCILTKLDLKSGDFIKYGPDEKTENSIKSRRIMDISSDHESNSLWFGSRNNGIERLDISSKSFKNYQHDPLNERSLSNNEVWVNMTDRNTNLWVGTSNGLNLYNRETDDFERFLNGVEIHTILEDSKNNFWLGTIGKGLILFNRETKVAKYFTKQDGMPSDFIFSLVEDNEGFIWIGSTTGLSQLNTNRMNFISYNKQDGVLNQFTKWSDGVLKTKNGDLLFGGNQGITAFSPDQFNINNFSPFVEITGLTINDKPYKENGSLDSIIILDHNQNDLTFEFVGLHFKNPLKNKYMIKLEPYEKEWKKENSNRRARYTNLDFGEYTFNVRASNSDGVWNLEGEKISIIINPPWWRTTTAYIFYGLFIILGIFSVDKFQRKRLLSKAKERMKIQDAEHRAKTAELQSKVIQAENDRKTKELDEARQLQLSMLPKELPKVDNLEIAVYMKTATEVGGDYYDFSNKQDGSLNICLGDATGHGMKAGTLVSMMKSLFVANSINKSLEEFFLSSNVALKNSKLDKMMMAFAMLNIKASKIEIANAGIPPIYVYRKNSKEVEEIKLNGLPLGAMKNTKYDIYKSEVLSGDTILILSDGFPELQNSKEELYGYERVINSFRNVAEKSLDEIINYLKDEGLKWVNDKDPDDDVTFVVIKVK